MEAGDLGRGGEGDEVRLAPARLEDLECLLEGDGVGFQEHPWSHGPGGVALVADVKCINHDETRGCWQSSENDSRGF